VIELPASIETEHNQEKQLLYWFEEAEIRPGQCIPATADNSLESSRCMALVKGLDCFESDKGWSIPAMENL
jgi:hypothetical protein